MANNIRVLTISELKALLAAIPQERWRLMILVGFNHGLRVSELIGLRGKDIQHGRIVGRRLKGSDTTIQEFIEHPDPELDESQRLYELAASVKPTERIFPLTRFGVHALMKRAGARAGIDPLKLHPHVLKHTCAMVGIRSMKINELQRYLGHKSLSSTGKYLVVNDAVATNAFAKAIKTTYKEAGVKPSSAKPSGVKTSSAKKEVA